MKDEIRIRLANCQNVIESEIGIIKDALNIKYGFNGTGKTTIAKAIQLHAAKGDLSQLKSFGADSDASVAFSLDMENVLLFNEDYVNEFVFKESEVLPNSFEVFMKTPEYESRKNNIDAKIEELKLSIDKDEGLITFFKSMSDLLNKLPLTKGSEFKLSPHFKAIIAKQNIYKVPPQLSGYQPFFSRSDTTKWIEWKSEGFQFDDVGICPFCVDALKPTHKEEKDAFISGFNKTAVKNINETVLLFDSLKEYLNEEKYTLLICCIKESVDEESIKLNLIKFRTELEYLQQKIQMLLSYNAYQFTTEDISTINGLLENNKINSASLDYFNSDKTKLLIGVVNSNIEKVLVEVDELKMAIGSLKGFVQACIKESTADINGFLESAGMNYRVEIAYNANEQSTTLLKYIGSKDQNEEVSRIRQHLSWGERNAFALALFMFYAISKSPDLIILDDPISSFDSNKKYAISNRLFSKTKKKSFANKTILLLTHDFQPIIDFVYNRMPKVDLLYSSYIENEDGKLHETAIYKKDVMSIPFMMLTNAKCSDANPIHRIISLRKYIEHTSNENELAYNILSSLIHGSSKPERKTDRDTKVELSSAEIEAGTTYICNFIYDFEYTTYFF